MSGADKFQPLFDLVELRITESSRINVGAGNLVRAAEERLEQARAQKAEAEAEERFWRQTLTALKHLSVPPRVILGIDGSRNDELLAYLAAGGGEGFMHDAHVSDLKVEDLQQQETDTEVAKPAEQMTVGSLRERLAELPDDLVIRGLSDEADSYRGYYEHVGIEPGETTVTKLSLELSSKVGTYMEGYKGGLWEFGDHCRVFVASHGTTGPELINITDDGAVMTQEHRY